MTPMTPTQSQRTSLDRVVALDERTIAGFPPLAARLAATNAGWCLAIARAQRVTLVTDRPETLWRNLE